MEFCLHYSGRLRSQDRAAGKHKIRQELHEQICALAKCDAFAGLLLDDLQGKRKPGERAMYTEHAGKRYWFLIPEHLKIAVDINITILVPHDVGVVVHNGGDIDNRVKTLFDSLRVPAAPSEIPASDDFDYSKGGMYCLLQDDKLINRVSIQTYRDYAPHSRDSVRCQIEIKTRITSAVWANLSFA